MNIPISLKAWQLLTVRLKSLEIEGASLVIHYHCCGMDFTQEFPHNSLEAKEILFQLAGCEKDTHFEMLKTDLEKRPLVVAVVVDDAQKESNGFLEYIKENYW